jgi:hypothetical protein
VVTVTSAFTTANIGEVRALFLEYGASLGFSLRFQDPGIGTHSSPPEPLRS